MRKVQLWEKKVLAGIFAFYTALSFAAETPFIDQVREKLRKEDQEKPPSSGSFIDSVKKQLGPENPSGKSYIEELKERNPEEFQTKNPGSFIEQERANLEPVEEGGAIQAVKEGKSDLKLKKPGETHHAFGIRYGAFLNRNINASASVQARPFNDIYQDAYAPDLSFFYEYQPFHSETYGNFGLIGIGGLAYYHGYAKFAFADPNPGGGTFPTTSTILGQFFAAPLILGVNYRFNLLKYLRPFVVAGPAFVGFVEMRNDPKPGNRGFSIGYYGSAGVCISLDWLSPSSSWDLYATNRIRSTYLTVEYSGLTTAVGPIYYQVSGVNAGFTFEY